ncbi:MAG TPA: metal ABC transporter permease [Anaerolineales bacterium]|nr:metal ABC transporter permease [Anaerolineales bacterium]
MFAVFQYAFIQNAFLAGSLVAIMAGILGYFLVARGLTFAGHALSSIGFAGAAGAVLLGISPVYGLLVSTVGAALAISVLGREIRERDVAIGVIMTFALGLGILFLSLYRGYAEQAYSILFGTIVGISRIDVLVTAGLSLGILAILALVGRPLLFSSFDPVMAEARGLPVTFLGSLFLILVAVTVSIAMQVIGVLLVFALLVGPPATAIRLVHRPGSIIILSIGLGLVYTWLGILLAANSSWPVSFYITTLAFVVYLPVRLFSSHGKDGRNRLIRKPSSFFTPNFQEAVEEEKETNPAPSFPINEKHNV